MLFRIRLLSRATFFNSKFKIQNYWRLIEFFSLFCKTGVTPAERSSEKSPLRWVKIQNYFSHFMVVSKVGMAQSVTPPLPKINIPSKKEENTRYGCGCVGNYIYKY